MTTVGHTITGLAIGTICMPDDAPIRKKVLHLAVFAALANVPDFKIKYWGHDIYYFSHSLFVNLCLIAALILVIRNYKEMWSWLGGGVRIGFGVAAWLSHLLLDSFYNHGKGVLISWPFPEYRLNLAMPWFQTAVVDTNWDLLRIGLIEATWYGTILLVVIILRRKGIFRGFAEAFNKKFAKSTLD